LETSSIPQLKTLGRVTQLCIDGTPLLCLGGELGNSNASDLGVLDAALARCKRMHLNTIMLPVYWDLVERVEETFDFSLVQGAIDLARKHSLRLVYLWFGTWKNSMSCYAPGWVKRDTKRFERVKERSGKTAEIVSPSSVACRDADAKAFAALMKWTKAYDTKHRTVVMAQVENEIGMIPDARDYSASGEAAYQQAVPAEVLARVTQGKLGPEIGAVWEKAGRKTAGTWGDVFGTTLHGDEVFAAWQFATYTERVAAAGKREYPLPMFTNAALIRPDYPPGRYPSGGPLPHLMELWQLGAPSLEMICPDIYFPNFIEWSSRYVRSGNPLFIPEMAPTMRAAANALYAIAQLGAIGIGPFSIENVNEEKERDIAGCFAVMASMSSLIVKAQQDGTIIGLSPQVEFDWAVQDKPERQALAGILFDAKFAKPDGAGSLELSTLPTLGNGRWEAPPGCPRGAAMILQLAADEFAIAGNGVTVTFAPADGVGHVGIESVQEGRYEASTKWIGGRWLNGDETHQGRHVQLHDGAWTVQRVKLYRYD
jgi:beta-galactosidase GanA